MRAMVTVPLAVMVVALVGWFGCTALGWQPSVRPMIIAGLTCLASGELAAAPLIVARNASQPAVAQAAMIGTIIHLFGSIAVAAVVFLAGLPVGNTFVYWMMSFYFATLIVLVAAFAGSIRRASGAATSNDRKSTC